MITTLRKAIAESGKSINLIASEAGLQQPTLHRFAAGGDMKLATAEKLADYFGLHLVPKAKRKRRK